MQFHFAKIPEILFRSGGLSTLPDIIRRFGTNILLILDPSSVDVSYILKILSDHALKFHTYKVSGEPSPERIDNMVTDLRKDTIHVVVAIGGGSVIDTGKAVSAMLGKKKSVTDFLEGVGHNTHDGSKVPFIAIPTTAGTGSEATKNAVLSQVGTDGYKKSIRHDNFVPDIALIDPELSQTCPAAVTAACGMDAFTQLLESYVSSNASPLTDALAYDGLRVLKDALVPAVNMGAENLQAREAMSYAALLSGITLANAGLGIVHGLASPMGGYSEIPHGVACGTLIGTATRININKLNENQHLNEEALQKYARIGQLFSDGQCSDSKDCCQLLIEKIESWIEDLQIPRLAQYGYDDQLIDKIVAGAGNKNNPVELSPLEIRSILEQRL